MEHIYLNTVTEGTKFDGFYVIKSIVIREASNGTSYLDLTIGDNSGTMDAKLWNLTKETIDEWRNVEPGVICKVRGRVELFKDERQIRIEKLRLGSEEDESEYEIAELVKKAPV